VKKPASNANTNFTTTTDVNRALWIAVGVVVVAGQFAAIGRSVRPADWTTILDTYRTQLFAAVDLVDPLQANRQAEAARVDSRYAAHPITTYAHTVLGSIFLLLAPLQFSRTIRNRYRRFHRWSGRTLLGLGAIIAISGFYFGVVVPFAGVPEALTILLFGSLFVVSGVKAFAAIRRGDVAKHREWMIRALGVAFGVATVRLVGGPIDLALAPSGLIGPRLIFVLAVWAGWLLSVGAAEIWIARTRPE
jgi:uncharacterized membrane protein